MNPIFLIMLLGGYYFVIRQPEKKENETQHNDKKEGTKVDPKTNKKATKTGDNKDVDGLDPTGGLLKDAIDDLKKALDSSEIMAGKKALKVNYTISGKTYSVEATVKRAKVDGLTTYFVAPDSNGKSVVFKGMSFAVEAYARAFNRSLAQDGKVPVIDLASKTDIENNDTYKFYEGSTLKSLTSNVVKPGSSVYDALVKEGFVFNETDFSFKYIPSLKSVELPHSQLVDHQPYKVNLKQNPAKVVSATTNRKIV